MSSEYTAVRRKETLRGQADSMPTPVGPFKVKYLEIDPARIEHEMQHTTAEYGWIGAVADAMETEVENIKLDIEELESDLKAAESERWLEIVEADKDLPKRQGHTIDDKKAIIAADPHLKDLRKEIIDKKRELNEAEHGLRQVSRIVRALKNKGRMLQSFVGYQRSKIDLELQDARTEVAARHGKSKED